MKVPVEGSLDPRLVQLDQLQVEQMDPRAPSGHLAKSDSGQQLFISSCLSHFPLFISMGSCQTGEQESGMGEGVVLNGYSISSAVWGLAEINQT